MTNPTLLQLLQGAHGPSHHNAGRLTLDDFQALQRAYDDRFIADEFAGFDKVRHTYAHMGKLLGRLAEYVQMTEDKTPISPDEIKNKVIPDLLVYAAWLAHEFKVNIHDAYLDRFLGNMTRLHGDKIAGAELQALQRQCYLMRQKATRSEK